MNIFKKLRAWFAARFPQPDVFAGAGTGLIVSAWLLISIALIATASEAFSFYASVGMAAILVIAILIAASVFLVFSFVKKAEPRFLTGLTWFTVVGALVIGIGPASGVAIVVLAIGVGFMGGGWATYKRRGGDWRAWTGLVCGVLLTGIWIIAYALDRWPTREFIEYPKSDLPQLTHPDPSLPGAFSYTVIHYGSGDNPQRPQFGEAVDIKTERVDGSKLIDGWAGRGAWARTAFWDTDAERLPLNGKAWVPEGRGPFPVVLIVHGNHAMEDFSDTGYDYLGELFASHGLVAVSVDQNFLNSSFGDILGIPDVGLDEENDARGWVLLKHLELFRQWNESPGHPLAGKTDLERVVLIGHSRGGEAVSEAAVFNRLSAYPDNALLPFDFDFGIRGVIAIAPVDGQYQPRDDHTRIRDTNYMVIHGSHDGDVTSYSGYATYSRTQFSNCADCFKTGYYLVGANHGQFNTTWGDTDAPFSFARWLNRQHLISGDHQRQVAKALFMAFLNTTLFDDDRYLEFLSTPERGRSYLPESTILLNQFQSADEITIANFLEDAEVESLTLPGARASSERLSLWREQHMQMKWHETGTAAVVLGWQPSDQNTAEAARYSIELPGQMIGRDTEFTLSLAALPEPPGELDDYTAPDTVDFSLELRDATGQTARILLSDYKPLVKQIEPVVFKIHALQSDRAEVVFNRFAFPVDNWLGKNNKLDHEALVSLTLVFDQTNAATIALERVAFSSKVEYNQ